MVTVRKPPHGLTPPEEAAICVIPRASVLAVKRRLSDLVNAAYGLTPEEVQLMWDTAPPRMPFQP